MTKVSLSKSNVWFDCDNRLIIWMSSNHSVSQLCSKRCNILGIREYHDESLKLRMLYWKWNSTFCFRKCFKYNNIDFTVCYRSIGEDPQKDPNFNWHAWRVTERRVVINTWSASNNHAFFNDGVLDQKPQFFLRRCSRTRWQQLLIIWRFPGKDPVSPIPLKVEGISVVWSPYQPGDHNYIESFLRTI